MDINNKLKFKNDGKFRIMVFTDLHEKFDIESERGKARFNDNTKLRNTAIETLKPDLIVFCGDNCMDKNKRDDLLDFAKVIDRIAEPAVSRGIPFAAVFGNHEHDVNDEAEMIKVYESADGSLVKNTTPEIEKSLNYNLLINSRYDKPVFNLWFIDSNNINTDPTIDAHYDFVHTDQIEWYENTAKEIAKQNDGKPIPALLFQHIPVPEIYKLCRKAKPWEIPFAVRGDYKLGENFYVKRDGVVGYLGQGPCSTYYNSGQFASWKKTGDVIGAFFGHDHLNDIVGNVDGIVLGQCKTGGFGVYTDGCRSGVRIIDLDENDLSTFKTEMHHFKDFGLKCESLGPIFKRITDRQSVNMTIGSRIAAGVAGAGALGYGAVKLAKFIKK